MRNKTLTRFSFSHGLATTVSMATRILLSILSSCSISRNSVKYRYDFRFGESHS